MPTNPTGQPTAQPSLQPSSYPTAGLQIIISFKVQQNIYFSASTAGWQSGITRAVASLYPSPSRVNVTILSTQVFSLLHREAEAQKALRLRRSLTGGLTVTYVVALFADSVDKSDSTGANAQLKAQSIITNAISSGGFTAALSGAGGLTGASVPPGTPAIIVTLAAIFLHTSAPTLAPSRATAPPTPTAPNAVSDPFDINTGNNKWIALSLGSFVIIFVFLFSVACHRMQHRQSKKKMEERGVLHDLERKSVHEQRTKKAERIASFKASRLSASSSARPRSASKEATDLETWTHSTRHDNPMRPSKQSRGNKDEEDKEDDEEEEADGVEEGDEEKGMRRSRQGEPDKLHSKADDTYSARMALLGIKPPAARTSLHALPQGASVSTRVEGEWVQKWSKSRQATYYKNTATQEVAWRLPGETAAVPVPVAKKPSPKKQERAVAERERERERAAEKERERKAAHTSRKEGHHDRVNPAFAHDHTDFYKPDRHRKARDEPPSPPPKHALEPILSRGDKRKKGAKHRVQISLDSEEPADAPPPDDPDEPPPDDEDVWIEKFHLDKQKAYYKHKETGKVTWAKPEGAGVVIIPYAKSKNK